MLAKCGIQVPMSDLFGVAGTELLDRVGRCPRRTRPGSHSLRRLIDALDFEIDLFAGLVRGPAGRRPGLHRGAEHPRDRPDPGARCSSPRSATSPGSPAPAQLTCWAGLTPKHHESDTHVHRGRITKQGSRLVRWAAIESVKTVPGATRVGALRDRVADRRGRNIGAVAAARTPARVRLLRAARPPRPRPGPTPPAEGGMSPASRSSLVGAGRAGHDPRSTGVVDPF